MEFIGMLKKISQKEVTSKSSGETFVFGEYLITALGDKPESVVFEVNDGEKHRLETFDKFNNKLCKVTIKCEARLYNSRYFQVMRGWSIDSVTND